MYLQRLAARMSGGFLLAEGDDATGAGGAASPPAAATAPAAPDDRTLLGGAGDDGGADAPAGFPENWRETLAGDDKAALDRLKRFAAPGDLYKSYREVERKLSARPTVPTLPENATEAEVAAYRKAAGIPEAPEGYGLKFADELAPSEADKAVLGEFMKHAHATHMTPAAAKTAFDFYQRRMGEGRAAMAEAAEAATLENLAELRKEYPGREYTRNFGDKRVGAPGIVGEFLAKHFPGPEAAEALETVWSASLPSGVRVGNYAPFVKAITQMARSFADDTSLIGSLEGGGGRSLEDEKNELVQKSVAGKLTKAEDARLNQLFESLTREGRNRAA